MKTILRSINEARAWLAAKGTPRTDITDAQMPGYLAARGDVTWAPPAPSEPAPPRNLVANVDEARQFLAYRGDATHVSDVDLPRYLLNTHGAAVDGHADANWPGVDRRATWSRSTPPPPHAPRADADTAPPTTVQHQVQRTDAGKPYAAYRRAHADSYGTPAPSAAPPPAAPPVATGGRYDLPATGARAAAFQRLAEAHQDRSRDTDSGTVSATGAPARRPNMNAAERAWLDKCDAAFKASFNGGGRE